MKYRIVPCLGVYGDRVEYKDWIFWNIGPGFYTMAEAEEYVSSFKRSKYS